MIKKWMLQGYFSSVFNRKDAESTTGTENVPRGFTLSSGAAALSWSHRLPAAVGLVVAHSPPASDQHKGARH